MSNSRRPDAPALGVKAAARSLNLSEQYVRRLADRGEIPHVRDCEGRRLFTQSDIATFAAKRR